MQILVEMLQCLQNCQKLSMSHTVDPLGLGQSFAEVGHNPFAAVLYLGQYSTNPHFTSVGVDDELLPWSPVAQERCCTHCLFQCLESGLCFCGPLECPFLFSQSGQQLSYICESRNEPPVGCTQPQETPRLVFVSHSWPALHSFHLFRVRGYS